MKITAAVTAVAGYVPDFRLTNADLAKMVSTNEDWIRSRTGIEERRILRDPAKATSDLVVPAVLNCCRKGGISPEEIDALIVGTITPDMFFPSTANLVSDKVGASNAWSFDLAAACSGFLYGLTLGASLIESGRYRNVVVAGGDKMSTIVDYSDRSTCIIFGDGAGAVLLRPDEQGYGLQDSLLRSDGSGAPHVYLKAGGSFRPSTAETVANKEHFIYQDGQSVFKFAVRRMAEACAEILRRNGLTNDDIAWLVPHQANKRIIDATADQLGLDKSKVMLTIQKFGNTSSGSIPLCLWDWEPRLKSGDLLLLTAFGGGFTWGASLLRWGYDGAARQA